MLFQMQVFRLLSAHEVLNGRSILAVGICMLVMLYVTPCHVHVAVKLVD